MENKNKEIRAILREIQSLITQRDVNILEIAEQEKRITFLEGKREEASDSLEQNSSLLKELQQEESSSESQIHELGKKLEQNKSHFKNVKTQTESESLEKEVHQLKQSLTEIENIQFDLLEKIEEVSLKIKDTKSFLLGSEKTLKDFMKEVNDFKSDKESKNESLKKQIISLRDEQLPSIFSQHLKRLLPQFKGKKFLAYLESKSCGSCRFSVDSMAIDSINKGNTPENCSACGRLIIVKDF